MVRNPRPMWQTHGIRHRNRRVYRAGEVLFRPIRNLEESKPREAKFAWFMSVPFRSTNAGDQPVAAKKL